MIVLGIDPGSNGGFALVGPSGAVHTSKFKNLTLREFYEELLDLSGLIDFAVVEKVHAMPSAPERGGKKRGKRVIRMGATSAFNFGRNVGHIEMALIAAKLRHEFVAPGVWQRGIGIPVGPKDETTTQKKNRHKALAEQLFPDVKITHAIADALLIAEYGRRNFS